MNRIGLSRRYLGSALFLAFALYAATVATALPWTPVFFAAALLLFYGGYRSYRQLLKSLDLRAVFFGVFAWLLLLVVAVPNLFMSLLLYTRPGDYPTILAPLNAGLMLFAFVFASPYYLIPAALYGDSLFLRETVISPLGLAGILAGMLTWTVMVLAALIVLSLLAERGRGR